MKDPSPKSDRPKMGVTELREHIGTQLDAYAVAHNLKSLRHRLEIGLNEVGALAYEPTRLKVQEICHRIVEDEQAAQRLFKRLEAMCADIQENGPWEYAQELLKATAPEIQAWYLLEWAVTNGNEREMELSNIGFRDDLDRIQKNLDYAIEGYEVALEEAKKHTLEIPKAVMHPMYRKDKKGKEVIIPEEKCILLGEGFGAFLPMAMKGREVGVITNADGDVFIGARGRISDSLLESCGLTGRIVKDPKNPAREVMGFFNAGGDLVVRKLHRGFLIVDTRDLDLARTIAEGIRDRQDAIRVDDSALGHTRVIQTTEKQHKNNEQADREHWERKQFLRQQEVRNVGTDEQAVTTAMSRPREEFYDKMLYIRAMYVYLDSVEKLRRDREEEGKEVTEADREVASTKTWEKMKQKVDELRCLNKYVDEFLPKMPGVHSVIDMAGGAGDLGLAVGSELMALGRKVKDVEIVDPQPGVDDFMHNIIGHLPFRTELQEIAHHNTGYLQQANIRPDSLVVAKHACGTLTDDIIDQWMKSESPMLMAMTCCQDKAKDKTARNGIGQQHWHDLCITSGLTGTDIPEEPGTAQNIALERIQEGQKAMHELDMARVEKLRRHGFQAELRLNPEFPKGDVIIARRLPKNFMDKLDELQKLETDEPEKFDAIQMQLDKMVRGGDFRGKRTSDFGEAWTDDDFRELTDRLSPNNEAKRREAAQKREKLASEQYATYVQKVREDAIASQIATDKKEARERTERLHKRIFSDVDGKLNAYIRQREKKMGKSIPKERMGTVMGIINTIIEENRTEEPVKIRAKIDDKLEEIGF